MTPDLLDADAVSRGEALGLMARKIVEGYRVGEHRSPFHGFAIEFAQPADAGAAGQVATILETWVQVRARRRRAQAVAGLVLSAVAVAAAFMLAALMR